jgi:hypothetical protein
MAPRSADALHILGLILFKTEKYSEAELWLREARSIDQDSASIALDLASTKYAAAIRVVLNLRQRSICAVPPLARISDAMGGVIFSGRC